MDKTYLLEYLERMIYGDAERIKEFYDGILKSWYALRSMYNLLRGMVKWDADLLTLTPKRTVLSKDNQIALEFHGGHFHPLEIDSLKMIAQRDTVIGQYLTLVSETDEEVVYKLSIPNATD
jgi:hypothetical protein